jgi:hypothetical protein
VGRFSDKNTAVVSKKTDFTVHFLKMTVAEIFGKTSVSGRKLNLLRG